VLLDTPTGIGPQTLAAIEAADEAMVITTPDILAVTDAAKSIMFCEQHGCNVLGVVINRYAEHPEELSIPAVEAMLERPVLGVIPEEQMQRRALVLQHPIQYTHPEAAASIEYRKLAARLLGQNYRPKL